MGGGIVGLMPKQHVAVGMGGGFEVRKKADHKDVPSRPDLNPNQGNLLVLMKAVRVLCNAWALCGADPVGHPSNKTEDGAPKRVRNIHLSQAQRYHEFVFEKSLGFGPGKKEVVS